VYLILFEVDEFLSLFRRHESGRVMLEGCLSEDYYLIRTLLYQQYAIV